MLVVASVFLVTVLKSTGPCKNIELSVVQMKKNILAQAQNPV